MKKHRPQQLDFFDQLSAGRLVADPRAPIVTTTLPAIARNIAKPLPAVHTQTASVRNRDNHHRQTVAKSGSARARVLACIVDSGAHGMTREEIAIATGLKVSSVCGRVAELLSPPDPTQRPSIGQNGSKLHGPTAGSGEQVILYSLDHLRFTETTPDTTAPQDAASVSDVSHGG